MPEEWKKTKIENPDFKCRECGSDNVEYREIESSDHDDIKYHCCGCNRYWYVEGSDY